MRIIRDYEVSIWTLQDSFITVLKPFGIELKGQIQDPDFKLIDDGTQEFTFKLPMYYSLNGERIENPLWCNTINGVIVASMRKVKLIFKKHTPQQKVYEFLITKVVESHEKDQLMCEVTCEGLAFHELGKLGYRISLNYDLLEMEQDAWYDGEQQEDEQGNIYILGTDQRKYSLEGPQPTLQYWNDKIFKRTSGDWKWGWTYEIQMNYSNNPGLARQNEKVYEDEYISAWEYNADHDAVEATAYENNREKYRIVDLDASNVYNLTQDIAKEFGVFCRYEYEHDDNFHIINRKVIYYNNFIMEEFGQLDITYPYHASKILRMSDSTDLITKLYVETESEDNEEQVTIINAAANKTREDYILNFDYLNTIGAITPQQYKEVKQFETNIHNLNMQIIPLQTACITLSNELPDLKANKTTLENSIDLDREQWSAQDDLLNSLTGNTGIIAVTANSPKMGIIMGENPNYINISERGVDYSTLHIYKTYNTTTHVLTDEYQGTPQYDEFNNLIQVQNLQHYQSYSYSPSVGAYTLTGEYGHLNWFNRDTNLTSNEESADIFTFLFNSKEFKNLFKKLNNYLVSSFQFSFNIDFEVTPSRNFFIDVYFLHKNDFPDTFDYISNSDTQIGYYNFLNNHETMAEWECYYSNTVERYTPVIKIDPTDLNIGEFRFNNSDINNGIYVIAKVTHTGRLKSPTVDNGFYNYSNGEKASLSLSGKRETTESGTTQTQSRVYLTYEYSPQSYYERVKEIWNNRLLADQRDLENVTNRIEKLEEKIDEYTQKVNEAIDAKQLLISQFERLMGPALREGYWQPEDYQDHGEQYIETFKTNTALIGYYEETADGDRIPRNYIDDSNDTKINLQFLYDSEPFSGEQVNYINSFSKDDNEEYYFYPCIKLNNSGILKFIQEHYNEISVSFYDVTQLDTKYITNPVYRKVFHINSKCQYAYMNINGTPTPVIMVTGARDDNLTDRQFAALTGQIYEDNGIIYDEFDNIDARLTVIQPLETGISASYKLKKDDWYIPTDIHQMLYPRLQISSLNIRTDNNEIDIKYNNNLLTNYKDYSLLPRENSYYATIKPNVFAQYGWSLAGEIRFIVSNANTAIYLDALEVSKENSRPKVEYEVSINSVNKDFIEEAYKYLGYIANINDNDLKFQNVRGYISELDMKLDSPQKDTITVKNYKTKFEDLFSTIVVQSEQMQKNAATLAVASSIFTVNGKLIPDVVEESIRHVNLDEAFSKGTLTWNEVEGLWAESDSGVVAIRGGGIFTATQQNANGSWKWNTGITPEGINADLITTGQLDTNRIKVYAGDQLRFQLNADGLFGYKTMFDNPKPEYTFATNYGAITKEIQDNHGIDYRQYVVHNGEGLFLIAKQGAPLILENRGDNGYYIRRLPQDVERVSITWDGLTLRNYNNEKVFYADADTGDLTLAGTIYAKAGVFEGEVRAKSLFIGDESTTNLIDEDGHLLPSAFGEAIANGITKAAYLQVDTDNGRINLSSFNFDHLGDGGAETAGIYIQPGSLQFYTQSLAQDDTDNTDTIQNTNIVNSMIIDQKGITMNADGLINIRSINTSSAIIFGEEFQEVPIYDDTGVYQIGTEQQLKPTLKIGGVSGEIVCENLITRNLQVTEGLTTSVNAAGGIVLSEKLGTNQEMVQKIFISEEDPPHITALNENQTGIFVPQNSLWLKRSATADFSSSLDVYNASKSWYKFDSTQSGKIQRFGLIFEIPYDGTHKVNKIKTIELFIKYNTFSYQKAKFTNEHLSYILLDEAGSDSIINLSNANGNMRVPDNNKMTCTRQWNTSTTDVPSWMFFITNPSTQVDENDADAPYVIDLTSNENQTKKYILFYGYCETTLSTTVRNLDIDSCYCKINGKVYTSGPESAQKGIAYSCTPYFIVQDCYYDVQLKTETTEP